MLAAVLGQGSLCPAERLAGDSLGPSRDASPRRGRRAGAGSRAAGEKRQEVKGGAPGRRRGTRTDWQELGLGPGRRPGHTSGFSSEARSVCPRGGSVYADKTETRSSACWSPLQGHLTTGPPSEWLRRDEGVGEGCFSGHPTKIPVSQSIWLSPGGAGTSTTHLMPHVLYPGAVPSQRP